MSQVDTDVPRKAARLEARVSPEQKQLFQRAAALQGRSLTDFIVSSTQAAAVRTIQDHEVIKLSREDSEAFVIALLRDSGPSPRLREAAERYRKWKAD